MEATVGQQLPSEAKGVHWTTKNRSRQEIYAGLITPAARRGMLRCNSAAFQLLIRDPMHPKPFWAHGATSLRPPMCVLARFHPLSSNQRHKLHISGRWKIRESREATGCLSTSTFLPHQTPIHVFQSLLHYSSKQCSMQRWKRAGKQQEKGSCVLETGDKALLELCDTSSHSATGLCQTPRPGMC